MKYNRENIFKYTGPESIPEDWSEGDYSFDGSNLICDEMCANLNNLVGYNLDDNDKPINVLVITCLDEYIKKEILTPEFQEKAEEAEDPGLKPEPPVISPAEGSYIESVTVTLSTDQEETSIIYSLGSDWLEYEEPIILTEGTIVSAYCARDGHESNIVDAEYTITEKQTVVTPVANPVSGGVASGTTVTLSCATDGAVIYYTTDGSTPTSSSTEYTEAITINDDITIKAIAIKEEFIDSEIMIASYSVYTEVPFSGLDDYLKSLEPNSFSNPYKLNITGLTSADCGPANNTGTLGNILRNNSIYLDLSHTELPNNLTNIQFIFDGCSKLVKIPTIPSGATNYYCAFQDCTSLTNDNIIIPSSVNSNLMCVFYNCSSLTTVTLNITDYTNIETSLIFSKCTSLQNIYVPSQVAKDSLIQKLGSSDFPNTLDKNEVIKVINS